MNIQKYALGENINYVELGLLTTVFGVGFVGVAIFPFFMYYFGAGIFWGFAGVLICLVILWNLEAYRLKRYKQKFNEILTLPGYFASRFGKRGGEYVRGFVAAEILLLSFVVISLILKEMGIILENITGIPKVFVTLIIIGIVCVYIGCYGFISLAKTSLIKSILLIGMVVAVDVFIFNKLGMHQIIRNMMLTDITGSVNEYMNIFLYKGKFLELEDYISLMSMGLLPAGLPFLLTSFFAAKNSDYIKRGSRIMLIYVMFFAIASSVMGIVSRGYLYQYKITGSLSNYICMFYKTLAADGSNGKIISYVFLFGIILAFVTTLEGSLYIMIAIIREDIIGKSHFIRVKKDREKITLVIISLLLGTIIYAMSQSIKYMSINVVIVVIGAMGCSMAPVVIMSLIWKNMNAAGCIAGLFFGFMSVPVFKYAYLFDMQGAKASLCDVIGVNSIIPSMLVSTFFIVLVSKITGGASEEIKEEFTEVKNRITD